MNSYITNYRTFGRIENFFNFFDDNHLRLLCMERLRLYCTEFSIIGSFFPKRKGKNTILFGYLRIANNSYLLCIRKKRNSVNIL